MRRCLAAACTAMCLSATTAFAQEPAHQHSVTSEAWQWGVEANVFAGYNYQYRKFTDFDEVESQNWLMTTLAKSFSSASHLRIDAMFSFEPFTLRDIGSPQVFQTGETFNGAPLVDYQHPHDLIMNLGAEFSRSIGASTLLLQAYAWGPRRSDHRCSCTGLRRRRTRRRRCRITISMPRTSRQAWWRSASSARDSSSRPVRFTARNRTRIGSISTRRHWIPTRARLSWADGPWAIQLSGADLTTPERKSPYDATRVTASVSYFKGDANRSIAWLAAFGQNREVFGNLEAYLIEATQRVRKHAFFMRAEWVDKDILDAGFHPDRHGPHTPAIADRRFDARLRARCHLARVGNPRRGRRRHRLRRCGQPQRVIRHQPWSFHAFVRYRGMAGAAHQMP